MPLSTDDLAGVIADAIKAATAPLLTRIAVLEAKGFPAAIVGEKGEPGTDGKDAEPVDLDALALKAAELMPTPKDGTSVSVEDVAPLIAEAVQKAVSALPSAKDGADGASVDPAVVEAMVAKSVAEIPHPKDGKDAEVDLDALALKVFELVPTPKDGTNGTDGEPGPAGKDAEVDLDALAFRASTLVPTPKDGASVTLEDVAPLIANLIQKAVADIPPAKDGAPGAPGESVDLVDVEAMVTKAVAAIPVPVNGKDGQSVTVEDVAPLVASEVEKAVKALPVPKDGVGVADALIGKDNSLVLTLSDGTMKTLGVVVGKDGERGETGVSGNPGADGQDGQNGTLDNVLPVYDGERTVSFQFKDGTPVEGWSLKLPMLLDRGVYSSERAYETGDVVSYGGSGWIAKADSQGKQPGTNDGAPFWRLAIKRGDVGKPGLPGAQGPKGDKGLDLRPVDVRLR